MTRFTLQISDQLNQWLTEQARLNHRSKNRQIEHLLDMARRMPINSYPLKDEKWVSVPPKRNTYG